MNYRKDKYGNDLSILGFGCMRFQQKNGRIDLEEAEREILLAFNSGVNYFDTAYVYGGSEAALGEILEKNGIREQINIATKLPHYLIKSKAGMERLFQEELKRLRTDHVDYYLMHMLTDVDTWEKLKVLGVEEWIDEKKANGQIRQIGFSYHGNTDISASWWMCMTGISAKSSTTIWMKMPKPDGGAYSMHIRKGFRLSLWSPSGAESWWVCCPKKQRISLPHTLSIVPQPSGACAGSGTSRRLPWYFPA